jgi:nitroreductase
MMDVLDAMRGRKSTRAYLDKPVARATIESILDAARWAPSGVNCQPWQVAVVTGTIKTRISEALLAARKAGQPESPDYAYYPSDWQEPYKSRRKATGLALYRALNIGKDDAFARLKAWNGNYHFFGAPAGLLFFVDRTLSQGAWVDMGMFIENVMLAARAHGLDTCPQASLAEYPDIVRGILAIPATRALVCGMALGYADAGAPVNSYRTEREPVNAFTTWHD